MTKPNPYLWPKGATVIVRDRYGEVCRSRDRRFDLADGIMLRSQTSQRTVTISFMLAEAQPGLSEKLESLIRYDLELDGYQVALVEQEPLDVLVDYEWRATIKPV